MKIFSSVSAELLSAVAICRHSKRMTRGVPSLHIDAAHLTLIPAESTISQRLPVYDSSTGAAGFCIRSCNVATLAA
jgi:hypothetical protein